MQQPVAQPTNPRPNNFTVISHSDEYRDKTVRGMPATWYAPFTVVENAEGKEVQRHKITTTNIYTYHCGTCTSYDCIHTQSVNQYVESELDKFMTTQGK